MRSERHTRRPKAFLKQRLTTWHAHDLQANNEQEERMRCAGRRHASAVLRSAAGPRQSRPSAGQDRITSGASDGAASRNGGNASTALDARSTRGASRSRSGRTAKPGCIRTRRPAADLRQRASRCYRRRASPPLAAPRPNRPRPTRQRRPSSEQVFAFHPPAEGPCWREEFQGNLTFNHTQASERLHGRHVHRLFIARGRPR
jgi:hypothetical protein